MIMKRLIFFVLLIWFSLIGVSKAEIFYLKSGEIVRGSIAGETGQKYKIEGAQVTNPADGSDLVAKVFFVDKSEILKIEQDVQIQDNAPSSQISEGERDSGVKSEKEIYDHPENLFEHWDKTVLPEAEKIRKERGGETNRDETEGDK